MSPANTPSDQEDIPSTIPVNSPGTRTVAYDIEVLKNFFSLVAIDVETKEKFSFSFWEEDGDMNIIEQYAFFGFLLKPMVMVGYNNLRFDAYLINQILEEDEVNIRKLYAKAQELIIEDSWPIRDCKIPQIDLLAMNGYDNPARMTSLKYLEMSLGAKTVMDMPIHHSAKVKREEVPLVLQYNTSDVEATLLLYEKSLPILKMRQNLSKKFGVDLINLSDPRMGEAIVLKLIADKSGIPLKALRKCRTPRKTLSLSDCILPSVNFKSKEFQKILDTFNSSKLEESPNTVVVFDNVEYFVGIGGLHACRGSGQYRNLSSADVTGYYPALAVSQGWSPHHFNGWFQEVYREIAVERANYSKGTDENFGLKIAQNGVFGKSNSEYSPFYDPKFFAQITINGQLLILMLCERLTLSGAARVILANTDGIEVEVKNMEVYLDTCRRWEKLFGLSLEHSTYKLMAVRDVNNYLAITTEGKIKEKGAFVTDPELHKDRSHLIVQRAVREYLVNGTPIEETIRGCKEVLPFLINGRSKTGRFVGKGVVAGKAFEKDLPKNLRYYASKPGITMWKRLSSGDKAVNKGTCITIANELPRELVNPDVKFYVKQANKLLQSVYGAYY